MQKADTLRLVRSTMRTVRFALPAGSRSGKQWNKVLADKLRANTGAQGQTASRLRELMLDFEFYHANATEHKNLVDDYHIGKEKPMRQKISEMVAHVGLHAPKFPVFENKEFVGKEGPGGSEKA